MSNKDLAIDLIRRLPEEVSLQEIAKELEFIAGVREGLESFEQRGGITVQEARAKLGEWTIK